MTHEHTWQTTEAICRCGQTARLVVLPTDFERAEAWVRYLDQRAEADRRRLEVIGNDLRHVLHTD